MNELEVLRSTYPRVSEIISKQNDAELRSVSLEVLANACIRGNKVHQYCTAYVKSLWISDIEEEYQPYVNAFKEWADANISDVIFNNVRLYDDVKRFSGEFDLIAILKSNRVALIDIKTSSTKSKAWPIQLSAYTHLCQLNAYHIDFAFNLHLKKTKAAKFEEKEGEKVMISPPQVKTVIENEYEDFNVHWDIFSSALKCYDYFDRKEAK